MTNPMATPDSGFSKLRLVSYPLFFASGAAGLIYEVVWTRMLIYVFGSSLYAVTAVLAAFMAGLALGSGVFGSRADRLRYPLRFYAILEILIGSAGCVMPVALQSIDSIDAFVYSKFAGDFGILTTIRFGVSFMLLLVPTTLMGATLPVISRALVKSSKHLGLHVGELYAVNTFGAVAGAFGAGFFLIGGFGVIWTVMFAAGLNFVAGIVAYVISEKSEVPVNADLIDDRERVITDPTAEAPAETPEPVSDPGPLTGPTPEAIRLVMIGAFIAGLAAMAAQVLWTRALVFHFEYLKNTTYAFSAMLTVFLAGLAIGGTVGGFLADKQSNSLRFYGIVLMLIGVSIAGSVSVLYREAGLAWLPDPLPEGAQELNWWMAVRNIMAQAGFVLGLPTFLMGLAFPFAVRSIASMEQLGGRIGRLYASNTTGAIIGPLVASFVIVPLVGLTGGLFVTGLLLASFGAFIVIRTPGLFGQRILVIGGCAALFLLVGFTMPRDRGMQSVAPGQSVVYYDEGPMATVAVVENLYGYRTINIDGVGVAGTDPMLQTDQKSLAHIPMLLLDDPKAALTVGFGSGGASYSFLLHDRLEDVHCVEICPQVPEAAPHLTAANHGFLEWNDPRYKIIFEDARAYLQHTEQTYDIIATDCTDLRYKSNANLYDLEYFEFCRERLRPGGMVVVWMPLAGLSDEMYRIALRTFHAVFPEMSVVFMNNEPTHYVLLLGWRDEMFVDYALIQDRLREADVAADLGEIQMADAAKVVSTWILGGKAMEAYLGDGPINTEFNPIIEFESPKYGYGDKPILDNLEAMMQHRNSALKFAREGSVSADERARIARFEEAMPLILQGHAAYRNLDMRGAAKAYLAAAQITPDDVSLKNLLEFHELAMTARAGSPWAVLMYGRVQDLKGNKSDAAQLYIQAHQQLSQPGPLGDDLRLRLLKLAEQWHSELKNPE